MSSNLITIEGFLHKVGDTRTVGAKGFQKREVVIDTGSKYDNLVPVEFTGDDVDLVSGYKVGEKVEIKGFLGGREWQGRYFLNVRANAIRPVGGKAVAPVPTIAQINNGADLPSDDDGQLPF